MSEKKQNLWKCFIVVAVGILCIAAGYAWAKNSLIMKKTDWQGTFQVGEHKFENAEYIAITLRSKIMLRIPENFNVTIRKYCMKEPI